MIKLDNNIWREHSLMINLLTEILIFPKKVKIWDTSIFARMRCPKAWMTHLKKLKMSEPIGNGSTDGGSLPAKALYNTSWLRCVRRWWLEWETERWHRPQPQRNKSDGWWSRFVHAISGTRLALPSIVSKTHSHSLPGVGTRCRRGACLISGCRQLFIHASLR